MIQASKIGVWGLGFGVWGLGYRDISEHVGKVFMSDNASVQCHHENVISKNGDILKNAAQVSRLKLIVFIAFAHTR